MASLSQYILKNLALTKELLHAYSNRSYPVGLCPNAESIMKRSFLIPFNELITKSEAHEISNRILEAVYNHF